MESNERRAINRCEIPGTHVYIRPEGSNRLFNSFSGPFDLIDMSEYSVCIMGLIDFETCKQIEIWMAHPDINPPVKMNGNILRKEQENKTGEFIYVTRINSEC